MELNVQKDQTPIYRQLYEQIVRQIVDGICKADDCLPSIRAVAKQLGVAVITVKTAYEMLERDGFIYTLPAKGCFVSASAPVDKRKLAAERLKKQLPYYKQLGIDRETLSELVDTIWKEL